MATTSGALEGEPVGASPLPGWAIEIVTLLAGLLIRLLRATVRLRHHGDEQLRDWEQRGEHFILAFWHRHLLLMPYSYRGRRISVLVSRSRDGELIARTVARFGVDSSRGSTSRGALAGLREILRQAQRGFDLAFTPDGPRGPADKVQPGVVTAAAATGWPIVPVALAASRCRHLTSWDRFVVPLPGSRVHFCYGPPLAVERDADPAIAAAELDRRIEEVSREAAWRARGETHE